MNLKAAAGILVLAFCLSATVAVAGSADDEIVKVMTKYSEAIRAKDVGAIMAMFAPANDAVMMGTGPGERWIGQDAIKHAHEEFFRTFEKESGETTWRHIRVEGDMAWGTSMSHSVSYYANVKNEFSLNNSFALRKYKGEWRIVMFHFSNLTGTK